MGGKGQKRKLMAGGILLGLSLVLQLAARNLSGFGEWYGTRIYPVLVWVIGGLSNFFPFSVVEISLYVFLLLGLVYGITHIRQPVKLVSTFVLVVGILAFSYTANCGINYYRLPFSYFLNLEIRPSSEEELKELCVFLACQAAEAAGQIETSEQVEASGQIEVSEQKERAASMEGAEPVESLALTESIGRRESRERKKDFPRQAKADMEKLGQSYPQLSGFYPRPKPLLVSEILSLQSLSGIYSPFTIEANYNQDMIAYNIPHTACHELSHLRGFMREEEANFIGYLACVGSDNAFSRYSGYLSGFIYASNALYRQNPEATSEVYTYLPDRALADLHTNNQFWQQYEGTIAEVSTKVNDTYLKANSQSDGVKSYGRMVDLLLAYYRVGED